MRSPLLLLAACVWGTILLAVPMEAQRSGDGFLFRPPTAILTLHGGLGRPDAGSEVFSFVSELLTLHRSDFDAVAAGSSLVIPMGRRVDLDLSATYMGAAGDSEFRDWVDQNALPIEQRTEFVRIPLIAGARMYLVPRGRSIGSFAWVPTRLAPFVGAGGGAMWYRFRQVGDFVDFEDNSVYADELESRGWTPAAQVSGGLDISLTTRLGLTAQANYLRASAKLSRDFEQFEPIDLSGLSAILGVSLRL